MHMQHQALECLLSTATRSLGRISCAFCSVTAGVPAALQLVLIAGGAAGAKVLRTELRAAANEQNRLSADLDIRPGKRSAKRPRVAVDATFLKRLGIILRM